MRQLSGFLQDHAQGAVGSRMIKLLALCPLRFFDSLVDYNIYGVWDRKGKTVQYDPIYVKKKNIKQFLYPETHHIYIHTDAHQTHKDTPDTQNVYTDTHIHISFLFNFYVFTNIKLISALCFIFFFYWFKVIYSISILLLVVIILHLVFDYVHMSIYFYDKGRS